MRVLVIPSWFPPNGGEFFVHQTKWLMDESISVHVITVEEINPRNIRWDTIRRQFSISSAEESGVPTIRFVQHQFPKLFRVNAKIWIRLMLWLTEKYIRKYGKPDLIQVHSCMWGGVVADRIKKKYRIPYLITEHRGRFNKNSLTADTDIRPWFIGKLRNALRNADTIIPVSALQIESLEKIAGVKLPVVVIPNPVDEKLFSPCYDERKEKKRIELLNISMFNRWKAIDLLLKSFARVLQNREDVFLHLVGDGPDNEAMKELAITLGIDAHVKFHGFLKSEAVRERLCAADYLVLSSITEGQPVVVGEALLCGKPVIATNVVSEEDVPDYCGYIAKAGDTGNLSKTILLACAEIKKFRSDQIRNFGMNRFAKSKVIEQVLKVMYTIVQKKTVPQS
jgi:glycosyltransferase involved in cell wall biosynthesis